MSWTFTGKFRIEAVGHRLWRLALPLIYDDDEGRRWVAPRKFVFDGWSAPRFMWWLVAPLSGERDRAAAQHDFERQCFQLLGLDLADVDGYRFREAMKAVGMWGIKRYPKSWASRLQGIVSRPRGDGTHKDERRNAFVYDEFGHERISLRRWCQKYYDPDGRGYRKERQVI